MKWIYKLFCIYRSYEVDETFPNTVVVTIDATHTMRMPPGLMRQMQNRIQGNNSPSQNAVEPSEQSLYLIIL